MGTGVPLCLRRCSSNTHRENAPSHDSRIKRHVFEHPNASNTHRGGIRGVMKEKEKLVKELLIAAVT